MKIQEIIPIGRNSMNFEQGRPEFDEFQVGWQLTMETMRLAGIR